MTRLAQLRHFSAGARPGGTVYLLHFSAPYRHARHYTGWTDDLAARLAAHKAGRGARLVAVVKAAGITFTLARTRPGTRADERAIKKAGGACRYCPLCTPNPLNGKWNHSVKEAS